MKIKKVLTVSLLVLMSLNCYAGPGLGVVVGILLDPSNPIAACAPEVQSSNINTTQLVLNELANNELANSSRFKLITQQISKMQDADRLNAYFKLVGVESDEDLVNLISSRENQINQKHIISLMNNAGLERHESIFVLNKLSSALLGQRK